MFWPRKLPNGSEKTIVLNFLNFFNFFNFRNLIKLHSNLFHPRFEIVPVGDGYTLDASPIVVDRVY